MSFQAAKHMYESKRFEDLLHMTCYAFQFPPFLRLGKRNELFNMMAFLGIQTRHTGTGFVLFRSFASESVRTTYWNTLGIII